MATSETVMDHFKGIFSKDNLKRILNIGGPIGVVAGILFSFGFVNPELALMTLLSLEGSALFDLLKESFTGKEYDEKTLSELCQEIRENKDLQVEISKYFDERWDDLISIIRDSNEEYKHLLYRNIHKSTQILENFKISLEKLDKIYTELRIKNFEIYLENEDPKESFENVKDVEDTDIIERPEVSKIIKHFQEENGMLVLEGFPTSGKSFVAYLVAKEWLKMGGKVAILRAGEVLQEGDYSLLRQEAFLAIADQNNELTDLAFRNMEHSAQKCLITRRLGEFARSPGILESRLTEKFVLDEDYLYNAEVTHGNIRCFLGEFEEIKEYIEICEKKFGIKVEAEAHENAVKQLHSLVLVQREDKRNSTALGLIYLIFGAAKGRNLDTLDMKSIYDIIGEKAEFKSIFESIYMNSWNEEQRKLARAMKLLNEVSEDYIFNKLVVERAYEAYHGNLEGYELALETLLKVRAINCNGYITFWHPFQLDVVDLYLSISVKIDIIEKLISNLERCLHSVNESERMELLLSLVKLSFSIDRSKSVGFVKALKTENEHFYRIGSMFVISQISEEFLSDFDFKHIRAFFRMVSTEDLADKETRMITLSFICFLTVLGSRENKEKLVDDIMTLASEELEDDEQINFYSSCVSRIAESGLPGKEKEEWIAKIETMARKTLKKEKGQINFYSICVSRIAQSRLLGKEKDKWIAEIETMARKTLEKGKEHANFYSICVSNIAQSGLPGKEKEEWIAKIETMARKTLKKGEEQVNFYSLCISNIVKSRLPGKEKEEWIEKIETMARKTLEKGEEQENFYSLCISNIVKSGLPGKEKEEWIEKIETMARKTLEKGEEQENFYSLCISNLAQSRLPGKEKEEWIAEIETMARKTLEKGEEQADFYSICVSRIAQSGLPRKRKLRYVNLICSVVKTFNHNYQQEIFSYCLLRIAFFRLPCIFARTILSNSSDKEELIKRCEDLSIDLSSGEKSLEIIFYLQDCLKQPSREPTIPR